jgi:hypothetical protein
MMLNLALFLIVGLDFGHEYSSIVNGTLKMTKHPTSEWEWEDTAEVAFQEWFNGEYGNFTFRCEWFFGDCEVEDVNTRKDLMTKWLHSAFLTGYNTGRCSKTDED